MLLIAVAASTLCCAVWAAALVGFARRPRRERAEAPAVAVREEDLVRPAVDVTGEPIWVGSEELFWHEIVCWPPRRANAAQPPGAALSG